METVTYEYSTVLDCVGLPTFEAQGCDHLYSQYSTLIAHVQYWVVVVQYSSGIESFNFGVVGTVQYLCCKNNSSTVL